MRIMSIKSRLEELFLGIVMGIPGGCMKKISIFLVVFIAGCAHRARKPENLTIVKERVEHYYESCAYEKEVKTVVDNALKHFKIHKSPTGSVVIFDVDDTLLSDYCSMKEVSFGFVPKLNHEWILKANAYAVPHIRELYDYLKERGYYIVILSGRKESEREATIKNLQERGFTGFKEVLLRQKHEEDMKAVTYKSARRAELIKKGMRIVGCVGDQWSDLMGGNTGYKVKLPNYTYIIY